MQYSKQSVFANFGSRCPLAATMPSVVKFRIRICVSLPGKRHVTAFGALRVCGTCHFGSGAEQSRGAQSGAAASSIAQGYAPASALVLAFSSTQLHGQKGIIAQIENICEQKHLAMAAAYCCVCRRCTWLCSADAEINEACLEFLHISRTTEQMQAGMALMHGARSQRNFSTSCSGPAQQAGESTESTSTK